MSASLSRQTADLGLMHLSTNHYTTSPMRQTSRGYHTNAQTASVIKAVWSQQSGHNRLTGLQDQAPVYVCRQ